MPEDASENKAKKLAAARKKLKEYQAKDKKELEGIVRNLVHQEDITSHEVTLGSGSGVNDDSQACHDLIPEPVPVKDTSKIKEDEINTHSLFIPNQNTKSGIDTIQILINEKGALLSELNKIRNVHREKELENEELQTQLQLTSKRLDELQNEFLLQQKSVEELKSTNLTLQVQVQTTKSKYDDQAEHLAETKKLLGIEKDQNQILRNELKDTSNELELTTIRINQISDETSITKDNRVESLTQTQFMYEQQIRDLQAIVQQLTRDKEQANQQYQTYVQHLNTEVANLSDKNNELMEECSKLQEREKQFIDHISNLEKEIQKSISRQDQLKESRQSKTDEAYVKDVYDLKAKLSEVESERHECQLKIKSQEDLLEILKEISSEKDNKIFELEKHIENIISERPDSEKLLATMESDKVAASRALTQNDALKKQLDELELRFVELTNEKADLVNKLDAEEYANREIRNSFSDMEEQVRNLNEKLHFKDEEMIRLTHENNDLARENLVFQQRVDRLQHYEAREFSEKYEFGNHEQNGNDLVKHTDQHELEHSDKLIETHCYQVHNQCYDKNHSGDQDTEHQSDSPGYPNQNLSYSLLTECEFGNLKERIHSPAPVSPHHHQRILHSHEIHYAEPPTIPTVEALQKLQSRFTKLMTQVADLTEEKQRLEHLVLQLQGETETIGEYIALYQTQRRILKQREYEKAAQLQLLLGEREEMREKITTLNKLVSNLGVELPNNLRLNENLTNTMENYCIEPNVSNSAMNDSLQNIHQSILDEAAVNKRLNSNESKEILVKIQNIITEIKENTKDIPPVHTADHLTCCSGKFEIV